MNYSYVSGSANRCPVGQDCRAQMQPQTKKTEKHNPYEFTENELEIIKTIASKRNDNGFYDAELNPEKLIQTIKEYDELSRLPINKQSYFAYIHSYDNDFVYSGMLKHKEAKELPDDSPLLRFNYIKDMKESFNEGSFSNIIKNKIYGHKLKHTKDPIVLSEVFKTPSSGMDEIERNNALLDGVNCAEGKYSALRYKKEDGYNSAYGNFDIFLQKSTGMKIAQIVKYGFIPPDIQNKIHSEGILDEDFIQDIILDIKYHNLKKCMLDKNLGHLADYLYNKYYLENIKKDIWVHPEVIEKCRELNNKHGVKTFLSASMKSPIQTLDYIDRELSEWKRASGYRAIMPKIINFNLAQKDWFSNISEETKSPAGAYATSKGEICYPNVDYRKVRYATRHEMTHINDITKQKYINRFPIFDQVKSGKYIDEFKRGGIPSSSIKYAHTDPAEYIAVAAEGNTKYYSPEFKGVLVQMGLPGWVFNLESID